MILLDSCTGRISWKYAEWGKFSGSRLFRASRDFANISTEGEKMKAVYGVLTCMLKVRDSETARRAWGTFLHFLYVATSVYIVARIVWRVLWYISWNNIKVYFNILATTYFFIFRNWKEREDTWRFLIQFLILVYCTLRILFATCFLSVKQVILFWTRSRVRYFYPIWTEMRETGRAFDLLQDCFANCSTGLKAEHRVGKKVEGWTFLGLVWSAFGNLFLAGSPCGFWPQDVWQG